MGLKEFYTGKTVFVTGHTGFKGSWLCKVLKYLGANVVGYSLPAPTNPSLYSLLDLESEITSIVGDVSDLGSLRDSLKSNCPDVVFHMAAQPLVSVGYADPVLTYNTNVMGTVNILEALRTVSSVKSFLNITTDKVYCNNEWEWGYRENEVLNGYDPYSNSKSCSELVTSTYANCFFKNIIPVSTARAGNVIGGGDFTNPRIIPDCVRAAVSNTPLVLRNPVSTRPYQHVLEPIFAYLHIAASQAQNPSLASSYNVGPSSDDVASNEDLVKYFGKYWGENFTYNIVRNVDEPHEANYLKLDCSKINALLGWKPIWDVETAVKKTVEWTKAYLNGDPVGILERQISEYFNLIRW